MSAELSTGLSILRRNLKKNAEDAQYVMNHLKSGEDETDEELKEILMHSVMEMMEMDGNAYRTEQIYEKYMQEMRGDDGLPEDAEMLKNWEKAEEEMGAVKGPDRKHFKTILKAMRDGSGGDGEDGGDGVAEMEVMQVQHSRKDPISKKDIVDPVITVNCKHVYDKTSILEFAGRKKAIKCAMQGCSESIVIASLADYPDYWTNIKQQRE